MILTNFQPEKYEPPLFVSGTDDDPNPWDNEPLKMTVGHVDSMHHKLAIKVGFENSHHKGPTTGKYHAIRRHFKL